MKRHIMGGVAVGLTVALGLTGCGKGSSSSDNDGGKTIKFTAAIYDDDTKPYWDALIKDFQAKNPGYKVNLEMVDWTQMDAKVKTYVSTKQTPDVLNYNTQADFARDGLAYPAKDVVSQQVLDDFQPVFREGASFNGQMYGLPFISSARLFMYNKTIFEKAGIKEAPNTWADVKADAEKIKKSGAIPLGLPLGPEEAQGEFNMWAMNGGGGWLGSDGKFAVDQPANVEAMQLLQDLTKGGLTQPNPEKTDRKDVFNQFAQGKIGMMNSAVFYRKAFIQANNSKVEYGIAPLPSKDGTTHKTLAVQDFLVAFKNSGKNQEAIKRFLNFFYQKENAAKFLQTESFIPVTKSAGDALSSDPYFKPFVDSLATATFAPTGQAAWSKVEGQTKQSIGAIVKDDPKKVLGKIQETAEKAG